MKRTDIKDTRDFVTTCENDLEKIDLTSVTDDDVKKLVVALALKLQIINPRTLSCPTSDPLIDDAEKATLMKSMYNKVYDSEINKWVTDKEGA